MFKKLFFASFWLIGMAAATTPAVMAGNLSLTDYWIRSSTGPNTAAYLTIANASPETDKLLKAECPDANAVELHNHIEEDGVMKMRPVPFIEVGPAPVEMKPGGLHIMLMDLKSSFQGKKTVPLTLYFEKAGKAELDVPVKKAIGGAAAGG